MIKRIGILWGAALGLLLLAMMSVVPAMARGREVVVERRDGNVTVLANGDLRFEETWEVRFVGGPFRFAFRAIPLNRLNDISDWRVSENGAAYEQSSSEGPGTFSLSDTEDERRITWYFPPTSDTTRTFFA